MLEISLLGQFDVKLDGETIDLPTRPSKLLLAYLALNVGKDIPRAQLGGILWPESLESTARKNLRNTVWRLRKAVGEEYILSDRETVAFNDSAPHYLDVALLAEKEETRGTEELVQTVSAYKGELLPGFYEDWVLLERERLRSKFEGRIQELLEQLSDSGRWPEVISWAELWISQGTVPEPAYRALMTAHYQQGDLAGMATAYQRCVQALKDELGVQPSSETELLYEELSSRQTPEPTTSTTHSSLKIIQKEILAKGGQGDIYRGLDQSTGQVVAIKQLRPELNADEPDTIERFRREGEALRQLNHPNIVKMLDLQEQGDLYRIVMEYVPGGTLRQLLEETPQLPLNQALDISLELADALARAHHLGIIHRDVKPGNVLLAEDGTPRLTDFGLARLTGEERRLTQTGSMLGSPAYMSPEALKGLELDSRSDVWSFGVLIYEILAGRHPFEGQQVASLLTSILNEDVPDISQFRDDLPPALLDLLDRMLVKDRERRLASMRLVAADLEAIRSGQKVLHEPFEPATIRDKQTIISPIDHPKLPLLSTPFIGREQEMEDLRQLLIDAPANNLVTLVGSGGIGKSRLALEAAASVADDFQDGVFFIPLAPLEDPELIFTTIAEIIELRFHSSGNPRQMLIDYLSRKNILLVLDNFEHILAGAVLVADILRYAKGVKILITSRERLHLINEAIYVVGGLKYPEGSLLDSEFVVQELANYGSMKLLAHHARLVRPDIEIDNDQIKEMARLCRLVQGMPLAIILAAGWLDMMSIREAADEIAQSLDFLESQMQDVPERQRSVRAAFDHSWKMLSTDDQLAFSRLSVFRGGFTRQAAQTITGAGLKTLRKLVDKSLISSVRPDRFEIHELLRQYAEQKLDASGVAEKTRQVHMNYYLDAIAQREANLKGHRQLEALKEIEVDLENVRVAWNWAVFTQSMEKIDEALEGLSLFFETRSRQREGYDFFHMATEQLNLGDSDMLLGRLLARKSFFMARFATSDEAGLFDLESSLSIADQHDHVAEKAFTQLAFGYYHAFVLGHNFSIALDHFKKSYALYQMLGDNYYCAKTLHRIGYCYGNFESNEKFVKYTREGMELAREIGDKFDLAVALGNLASGSLAMGEYDVGESYLRESLVLAEELGDRVSLGHSTMQIGIYRFLHGNIKKAKLLAEKGFMIASELNFSVTIAYSLAVIGLCEALTGDHPRAIDLASSSEKIPSNPFGGFLARWAQTITYCGIGELEQAKKYGELALQPAIKFNWTGMITWFLPVYIIISAQEERLDEAVSFLALAETHPMSILGWAEKWGIYCRVKEELAVKLDQDQYQNAWNKGLNLDLEETAAELIATFES